MLKLTLAAALATAGSASAAEPGPIFDEEIDQRIERAIPHSSEVEAWGPVIDRVLNAFLDVNAGPVVDAIEDPWARRGRYRPTERTLRDMAGRDDPYFEERIRSSIYGTTVRIGRMMDSVAIVAPIVRRSLADMERDIARAVRERPVRRPPPRPEDRWED